MVWNKFDFPDLQETGSLPIETNNLSAKNMFFLVFFGGPRCYRMVVHREVEKSTVNFLMSTTSFSAATQRLNDMCLALGNS